MAIPKLKDKNFQKKLVGARYKLNINSVNHQSELRIQKFGILSALIV
jgi:hypothetical protein